MGNLIIFTITAIIQTVMYSYVIINIEKLYSKNTLNKLKNIFIVLGILLIIILLQLIQIKYQTINILFANLLTFLLFKFIIKFDTKCSLMYSIMLSFFTAITELIVLLIGTIIFKTDIYNIFRSNKQIIVMQLIQLFLSILLIKILKFIIKNKNNILIYFNKINYREIILFIALITIYIFPQMIIFVFTNYSFPKYLILINTIQFILIFIFLSIYLKKSIEYEKAQSDLYTSELHNKTLIGMVDGVRTIKHDYNNIIQALSGYIATKQYDKLQEHINSVLKECNIVNNLSVIDPKIFNEPAIYGIVGAKYFLANNQDITFDFDILTDISKINFTIPDLSRILGILLDNAIEATKKSNKPYLRLEMKFDKRKNSDIIRIINTYNTNTKINLKSIYNKGFSTKKIKSGIGLWEVKKLINKNKQSQIFATIEKDKFVQNIIIEKDE